MISLRLCFFISMAVLVSGEGRAQPVSTSGTSTITVQTDVDSAIVVLDGEVLGRTPLTKGGIAAGDHAIRVLHPDLDNWLAPVIEDSVRLQPGEQQDLRYRFDHRYMVRSEPSGANVMLGDRVIGTTPLVFEPGIEDSVLQIQMPGFETSTLAFVDAERGILDTRLNGGLGDDVSRGAIMTERDSPATLPLVLSGLSTVVAGGFSAYFKVQADESYSEYLATGDPVKRAQASKLDNLSGVSLAASQIYLALFTYLLLSP